MKNFWPLVQIQLKDKIDLSWTKKKSTLIQKIVFGVLKFVLVAGVVFGILFLANFFRFISNKEFVNLLVSFCAIYFVLDLISCSYHLMKSLYLAEDNKLLVTYPVSAGQLFISKLVVSYLFELKKSLNIFVPVVFGFLVALVTLGNQASSTDPSIITSVTGISFLLLPLPVLLFVFFTVTIGALLSVPFLYGFTFIKRYPVLELILTLLLVGGFVYLCISVISLIPSQIDLDTQFAKITSAVKEFINKFGSYAIPINHNIFLFTGELVEYGIYRVGWMTLAKTGIFIAAAAAITVLDFLVIRKFYFYMMTRGSEFDGAANDKNKKNVVRRKYVTFANKEMKLSFRDIEISGSYISVYILVPILLYFIDAIFSAISTRLEGDMMTYSFNILLILLPLLASNSMIASLYSKEGRAAYIKKTKPIDPLIPLISKLIFNLIFSVPSIGCCAYVFSRFSGISWWATLLLAFTILFAQYAHIFYSASLDIMNPQNEAYATDGSLEHNPNENISTASAFIASFVLALLSFLMFKDSYRTYLNLNGAFIKMFVIALIALGAMIFLFVRKIKAYYYEK